MESMKGLKTDLPTINRIKQRAKKLAKNQGIKHNEALEKISQELGFNSWRLLQKHLNDDNANSTNYIDGLVSQNKRFLTKLGIEFSTFEPTDTGLKKSILDATQPVRTHLELENYHSYDSQGQGPENKVIKSAYFISDKNPTLNESKVSLYRPNTKSGDPRMWFRKLSDFANAKDQIAIIINNNNVHLINLTSDNLEPSYEQEHSIIGNFLRQYVNSHTAVASELLAKLRVLAKQPFPSQRVGDTGVGYTLETLLGIPANSSKQPDYKGIELKAGRGNKTRTNLFAQVADWKVSPCKRSAEILDKYGYKRGEDDKLYCTISTQRTNSQGLSFVYDSSSDELQEWHNGKELVAIWPGSLLRKRLLQKHSETFWIEVEANFINGIEHFQLKRVTHTKSPLTSQLLTLVELGVITMDHLIKRSAETGRVSEKGPLFKIDKKNLDLLFPVPVEYMLNEEQ